MIYRLEVLIYGFAVSVLYICIYLFSLYIEFKCLSKADHSLYTIWNIIQWKFTNENKRWWLHLMEVMEKNKLLWWLHLMEVMEKNKLLILLKGGGLPLQVKILFPEFA